MSDLKYLDYNGLITYTDHVKDFVNSKIVYLEDESQIPDPPVEGTLYVIGSNILLDEELIFGTQPGRTANWAGNSIDTQLHNGKRILYWLPYAGNDRPQTLDLTFSDEDNTQSGPMPIYKYGNTVLMDEYPPGSVIKMIYLENVIVDGTVIPNGWWCESKGKKYSKVNLTSNASPGTSFTCNETITIPAYSWCHVRLVVAAPDQSLDTYAPFGVKLVGGGTIYDMAQGVMLPLNGGSPGQADMWYYNSTRSNITAQVDVYTTKTDVIISRSLSSPMGDTLSSASYYEIFS